MSSLERLFLCAVKRLLFADDVLDNALPCMFKAKSGRWSVIRGRFEGTLKLTQVDRQHSSDFHKKQKVEAIDVR